ncbi:MAG TPA: serine hydroxymethyltransferase [Candidatus Saccharimonadales bacterium]|nr:serine hydroxymethyltransferase [Candidatus Saccharimonadales bacterium]
MDLGQTDPKLLILIEKEEVRQKKVLNLVASENYVSKAVREASGSILTNKYAEGYPKKRYYGGTGVIDEIEQLAIDRAKQLFGAEHANVQPYSGTNPNLAVYFAAMEPGDTALAMNLQAGGHLSHGSPMSISGKVFRFVQYGVNLDSELLDYDEIETIAKKEKPKLIVAGASAYSRLIDYKKFREIADSVGALLLVDMAHIAGLVAAGVLPSPVPYAHFVTTSTHKTLRGPRGGMILTKEEFAEKVDKMLFPGMQGGPLENIVAAKAVAFEEASKPEFKTYSEQIIKNAQALSTELKSQGFRVVADGTDNHLLNLDFGSSGQTGKEAEALLEEVGIIINREVVPRDTRKPYIASGIRLGSPTVTTRGMKEAQMKEIAELVAATLKQTLSSAEIIKSVAELVEAFPFQD